MVVQVCLISRKEDPIEEANFTLDQLTISQDHLTLTAWMEDILEGHVFISSPCNKTNRIILIGRLDHNRGEVQNQEGGDISFKNIIWSLA